MTKKSVNVAFKKCETKKDLEELYDYEVDVFAEAGDFEWSLQNLQNEKKDGWSIYSVSLEKEAEIIAALFVKESGKTLLTKNTSVKMSHKGLGVSHKIKEFFESEAKSNKATTIEHFCAVDNFRTITLNEKYGYERVDTLKSGEVIRWKKEITRV